MGIRLAGSIIVALADEELDLPADGFRLEEDGVRDRGDGDRQYEALFFHIDDEDWFRVSVQAHQLNGSSPSYSVSIEGAGAEIVEDNLAVEAT